MWKSSKPSVNMRQSAMPNFFIVGAAKSGTTSLYQYLHQCSDVYMSPLKEPNWFSRVEPNPDRLTHAVTSEDEYLRLFENCKEERAVGEASPSYLWDERAPYRIKEAVPHARIFAILRNPVERAYSHYLMDIREGKQSLPFLEAITKDYEEEVKGWGISHLYVELGFYARQLQRYFDAFGMSQVRIFLYEDLKEDPRKLIRSMLTFLEVDPSCVSNIDVQQRHNSHVVPRNVLANSVLKSRVLKVLGRRLMPPQVKRVASQRLLIKDAPIPKMEEDAKEFLMNLYLSDIQHLQRLIDRDLGPWLGAKDAK